MKQLLTFVTISLALVARAEDQKTPSNGIEENTPTHEGVWKPIAAVLGGQRLPEEAVKAITLKITGDQYEVTVEGENESDKGTCILDTTTTPKRMTIKSTEGPNRGKTFLAIYEMKDDVSMRVCYDLSGKEFPTEFKAPPGTRFSKRSEGPWPTTRSAQVRLSRPQAIAVGAKLPGTYRL